MTIESNSPRNNPRQRLSEGRNHQDHDSADSEEGSSSYRPELSNDFYYQGGRARRNFNDDVSYLKCEPWDEVNAGKHDSLKENYDSSKNNADDIDPREQHYNGNTNRHHDAPERKSYETNFHDLYHSESNSYSEEKQGLCDIIREEEESYLIESESEARPLIDIDFTRIRCPQSIDFDQAEEYYCDHDQHQNEFDNLPMLEVSFNHHGQNYGDYQNDTHSFDDEKVESTQDDYQSYCEESQYSNADDQSIEDDYLSLDNNYNGHRSNAHSSTETIFPSSGSLNVIQRIESVTQALILCLDKKEEPILRGYINQEPNDDTHEVDSANDDGVAGIHDARSIGDPKFFRNFGNIAQSRSVTSICLVMSFIHQLLLSNRTTTTREVYYVFVTHFRNQRECDAAILDVAKVLGVSRRSLGLFASPKGWFCGCVEITRKGTLPSGKDVSGTTDGTALFSIQGLPITKEWTERDENGFTDDGVEIQVFSESAKVILVIEKEGVYNRLSEERIFDRFPCILVTGKGFPDLATRALVSTLHRELQLPVAGICDCNPFGISVLSLYYCAGDRMGVDGRRRYQVPIKWLGLRPSKVAQLKNKLPETVFQTLTDLDNKRIASLLDNPDDPYLTDEDEAEVRDMKDAGYKVELEALYWIGPDFMGDWVVNMLKDDYGHNNNN